MTQPRGRSLAVVDADLRSCRFIKVGAQLELAEVRRRQAELAEIEAVLVMTVECRAREADRLLDERLRAVAGVADLPPVAEPVEPRGTTDDRLVRAAGLRARPPATAVPSHAEGDRRSAEG